MTQSSMVYCSVDQCDHVIIEAIKHIKQGTGQSRSDHIIKQLLDILRVDYNSPDRGHDITGGTRVEFKDHGVVVDDILYVKANDQDDKIDANAAANEASCRQPYYGDGLQPWDLIVAQGHAKSFAIGNVLKYVSRTDKKDGLKDLEKAEWYLKELIKLKRAE